MRPVNKTQFFLGFAALFLGLVLYFINRPSDIYFIALWKSLDTSWYWNPPFFGSLGGALPSFLNVFPFSLFLASLLACQSKGYFIICFMWFFINVLFEVEQNHGNSFSRIIPDWFEEVFILENLQIFFSEAPSIGLIFLPALLLELRPIQSFKTTRESRRRPCLVAFGYSILPRIGRTYPGPTAEMKA